MGAESLPEVPGYRLEELLGFGGMGVVYRAFELELGRHVALKLIRPEYVSEETFRRRFLRESRLAASLDHPNVIPIYAAGEAGGVLYLSMRYVEGSDLRTRLRRDRTLTTRDALTVVAQLAGALDAAHARGLVHRDVKPSNVLLDARAHVYLSDFGLSKRLAATQASNTGQFVGTLDYIAPEQIRGAVIDGRADQYALACLLFECVMGTSPFHRESEAETLWAHMQEAPPQLPAQRELEQALARALAKDPDERFASCTDFASATGAALPSGATVSRRPSPRPLRSPRPSARRGRVRVALGLASVAAAGTAALLLGVASSGARLAADSVAAIDPASGRVVADVRLGKAPADVVTGGNRVWILSYDGRTVWVFAPARVGGVTAIRLGDTARSQWAADGTEIGANDFVVGAHSNTATLVSQARAQNATIDIGALARVTLWKGPRLDGTCAAYITGAGDTVWVSEGQQLSEIDALTGLVLGNRVLPPAPHAVGATCYGVRYTGARLLAARSPDASIGYLDAATGAFTPVVTAMTGITARRSGNDAAQWAVGFGSLWIAANGTVTRVELRGGKVAHARVARESEALRVDSQIGVWVLADRGRTLLRLDSATLRVSARIPLADPASDVTSGYGRLWLSLGSR